MFAAALFEAHPTLRLGLSKVLSTIESIGEIRAYDPQHLDPVEGSPAANLVVQILLFGVSGVPDVDRDMLARAIALTSPRYVLLLTGLGTGHYLQDPRISGMVSKSASPEVIAACVRMVIAGARCFPGIGLSGPVPDTNDLGGAPVAPGTAAAATSLKEWPSRDEIAAMAKRLRITPRQLEILMLQASGYSHKGVGRLLGISEATVKAHASAMYRRMSVTSRQGAIQAAIGQGVSLPSRSVGNTEPGHASPGHASPGRHSDEESGDH